MTPSAAACGDCHPAIVAAWAGSAHGRAATNAVFVDSWVGESRRDPWCLGCHAPAADASGLDDGVGCGACHLAHAEDEAPGAARAACEGCHRVPWPAPGDDGTTAGPTLAQDTWGEWQRWGGGQDCTDCHLVGHTFPGARAPGFVAGAVRVEVARARGGVRATLSAPGVGHRWPTGDPFRALTLTVAATPACAEPLATATFGRQWAPTGEGPRLVGADTLRPGEVRTVELAVPEGAARWFCLWEGLVDPARAWALPVDERAVLQLTGPVGPPRR